MSPQAHRLRNHWGWGWDDKFPRRSRRLAMAAQVRAHLGFGLRWPRNPTPLEGVRLPKPRRPEHSLALPSELAEFVAADDEARVRHTYGRAYRDVVRGFYGDFLAAPDLVAMPRDEHDVTAVLEWASKSGVPVVPWGGGTNVVGATERQGCLALDMARFDRVLEVDDVSRAARVQAGAFGPSLERDLAAHSLTLRHFPQSFEFSTLGGWLATRSGGHFATGYTHIDEFVESMRVLTPTGVSETRRLPASGAGPSADRLVLGSEGTLGVITEAWMRVLPRPTHRSRANVFFRTFEAAVDAVRAVAQSGLQPSNCRLLDADEAHLHRVVKDGSCVLILGFEAADRQVEGLLDQALALARRHGGLCPDGPRHRKPDEAHGSGDAAGTWRQAFFDAPYFQTSLVSLGVMADTFETACTWDRFAEMHGAIRQAVTSTLRQMCGKHFFSCRFTHVYPDGPAPYYTFVAPVKRGAELEIWEQVKDAASRAIHQHGGTITHHHSVGRTHRPTYLNEIPQPMLDALRAAKKAVDPAGILNPGSLFAEELAST